jgi:hypothetical protein
MIRLTPVLAGVLLAAGTLAPPAPAAVQTPVPADDWIAFEGSWSATGERHTLPTQENRTAAIVRLSGSVVLTAHGGLGRGFRGEAIGYDNGYEVGVGRWVWTDDRGDRLFGELKGGPVATGRRAVGIVTGGTGRYAGIRGEYEFTWQYVVSEGTTMVQGRTTGLKGRFRRAGTSP